MKNECTAYCKKNHVTVFNPKTNSTEFASQKFSVFGEQEAVRAAKLSRKTWAVAVWRENKNEISVMTVRNGVPVGRRDGRYGDFGICGQAAEYLKKLMPME